MRLNCTFKMVKMINFVLYIVYYILSELKITMNLLVPYT